MHNTLKKLICLVLALALLLCAAGCSGKKSTAGKKTKKKAQSNVSSESSSYSSSDFDSMDDEEDGTEDWEELPEEPETPEDTLQVLNVRNGQAPTTSSFKGLNYVFEPWGYHNNLTYPGKTYTESQRQTELKRIQQMGIQSIRTYYGSALAWDADRQKYDFESTMMQEYYNFCLDMQKIGVDLAITANWTLSAFLKDGSANGYFGAFTGCGFGVENDLPETCRRFRSFIAETAKAFPAHGIKNVKYFLGYTECNNTFNSENADKETTLEKRDYDRLYPIYDAAIRALDNGLKDSGLRSQYKLVAPCDNWRSDDGSETYSRLVRYTLKNLYNEVDIVGSHRGYDRANEYPDDHYYFIPQEMLQECKNEVTNAGKEFWIDEYNVAVTDTGKTDDFRQNNANPYKGTALGALTSSVLNMGASNVYLWSLADQQWHNITNNQEFVDGLQIGGYLPSLFVSYTPMKAWYAASLMTKYLGAGKAYYCDEGDSIYTAAVQRNDGHWTFVVTNYSTEEVNIKLQLEKSIGGRTVYRYAYNPDTVTPTPEAVMNGVSAVAKNVKTGLYDTVKPYSVYVYSTYKD